MMQKTFKTTMQVEMKVLLLNEITYEAGAEIPKATFGISAPFL